MKTINYQLRKGVNLVQYGKDFYLLSEFPLIAVKVNQALYDILSEMDRSKSLVFSPEEDPQLIDLLERLVIKGMLTKIEKIEMRTYPTISIIIPVRNRPQDIQECLTSFASLDYLKDRLEIIVVDDGSTDSTSQVIETFKFKTILLAQSIGASGCRNLAAKEARGDLIGFTDSDCMPHPCWLKELVPYFDEEEIGIVGGYVSNFYNRSSLDRYEEVRSPLNMGLHPFRTGDGRPSTLYVPSCNLIIRKKAFLEVGGFQEDLNVGEDVDLCWRVGKLGYQLLYVPKGEVRHKHRNNLRQMLMRRYDYGTSEAILYSKHRDKRKMIYFLPLPLIFYGSISVGIVVQHPLLFVIGLGTLLTDFCHKYSKMRKNALKLPTFKVFFSVLRSNFSFSYLTSSYLVRYYLLFLLALSFLFPNLELYLLLILIFSGGVDFSIKRPKINFFFFLFFYTLDQLAYQSGVLLGCIKEKTFMPYVPSILRKL